MGSLELVQQGVEYPPPLPPHTTCCTKCSLEQRPKLEECRVDDASILVLAVIRLTPFEHILVRNMGQPVYVHVYVCYKKKRL